MARSSDDACECLRILTIPSDSSAAPGLRLPGWLHCQEGFRPWTVAFPPPVQRLLPWNTCRERQGLVRFPTLSSGECDFMSRLTTKLTDRHDLTCENQKLQGKSPSANGGSVQRLVRCMFHSFELRGGYSRLSNNPQP